MILAISDSKMKAGDNGEYFYDYVMNNHPDDELYFFISVLSPEYERLKNKGFNVIDIDDERIPDIYEKSDYILFSKYQRPISRLVYKKYKDKCIFLNHGVTSMNLIKNYYSKINEVTKYLCSVSSTERLIYKTLLGITTCEPVITGFARWDSLIKKNENREKHDKPHILITFHWRDTELKRDENKFKKSDYLNNINSILNSDELKIMSEKCEIRFMYHAMFAKYKEHFKVPEYIKFGTDMQFQDMLVDADAIVTDVSSNSIEMAVINKPAFFYFPDMKYVVNNMKQYNIDGLKNNSIGKFCDTFEELIESLNEFISGNFKLTEKNKINIERTIGNVDTNNCDRIYNLLLEDAKSNLKTVEKKNNTVKSNGVWTRDRKIKSMIDEGTVKVIRIGSVRKYL